MDFSVVGITSLDPVPQTILWAILISPSHPASPARLRGGATKRSVNMQNICVVRREGEINMTLPYLPITLTPRIRNK